MIDSTNRPLLSRLADMAMGRLSFTGQDGRGTAAPQTLMWLAGAGYRPRRDTNTLKPSSKKQTEIVDSILGQTRPAKPIEAAAERMALLQKLRFEAEEEPRVQNIFASDPIVVEDAKTGIIVTESMLAARVRVFDILDQLFEELHAEPMESKGLRYALIDAFSELDNTAQKEWASSEIREAQLKDFLSTNTPTTVAQLIKELMPVYKAHGSWDTMRLLTHAAAMAQAAGEEHLPVVPLLKAR